jgi:hypothetical protein
MSLSEEIWESQNFTRSPLNPPEGDLKDFCSKKNYVKMNEFYDIVLKSPSGGFRGLGMDTSPTGVSGLCISRG